MAIMKQGGKFVIVFKPFGQKRVGVTTDAHNEHEARVTETLLKRACKTGNYVALDDETRELCVRMFQKQGWSLPEELDNHPLPETSLTLWAAVELFLKYPVIVGSKTRTRYEYCLAHLVERFGHDRSIRSIWVPDLRQYQYERLNEGAAPTTINWELATLSKLMGVLMEMQLIDANPCRLISRLSPKTSERDVYLSVRDFTQIIERSPRWFRSILMTAYYTGMRRGEILDMTWPQINLDERIVRIGASGTKEGRGKRIPLRMEVVNVLEASRRVRNLHTDRVFLIDGRIPHEHSLKNPWRKICAALNMVSPRPRFHDLRHTWRTNAFRSGMPPQVAEAILGHADKLLSVQARYLSLTNQDLRTAVDAMTFDHGTTEIFVSTHQIQAR